MPKAFAIIILFGWAATCCAPSTGDAAEPATGEIFWLPLPVEEIETPDELDDGRAGDFGLYASAAVRDGRTSARRVSASGISASLVARASVLGGVEPAEAWTLEFQSTRSGVEALAGRITSGAAGMPFAEAVGLARRASRVPIARGDIPALAAPTGASSPALEGFAMARPTGPSRAGGWLIAGRRTIDGARIAAAGIAAPASWGAWGIAAGTLDGRQVAGASIATQGSRGSVGAEASAGPRGPTALVSIESGRDGVSVRGRWRYRAA
ncbi:MAG: hypothetical protein ACRENN_07020, partial [Candidatus Eiseniibacteriota bacterium]